MHTDDDIFESLDIDEGSSGGSEPSGAHGSQSTYSSGSNPGNAAAGSAAGSPAFRASYGSNAGAVPHTDASDDIFEDLDMEERIYQTAFVDGGSAKVPSQNGRNTAAPVYSGRRAAASQNNRSTAASQNGSSQAAAQNVRGAETSQNGRSDLERQSSRYTRADARVYTGNIAQSNQASRDQYASAKSVRPGQEDAASESADSRRGRRSPRELNTVDTSVDNRKFTRERETKKKSKIKKIIICTVVELFTLAAIFVYGYFLRTWNLISRPEVRADVIENNNISVEKKKEMEGYWNIAVFGVDSRSSNVVERGLNSDVIIIASINKDTGDIKLVSVFRDTYLNISESNTYNKINAAYAIGGPEQALAALNKNLDLNIQHYVAFNWKAVAEGINILGGVDNIPISKAELYYINAYITETVKVTKIGSVQLTSTGEQHLDGVQAVAYGRLRYMDSDFARTERQRNIIKAAFAKAKTAGFSVLNNIMVVCFPQVATNIDFNEVISMAQNISQYNIADTGGFPWSRGDASIGSKGDCVIPTTLESNVVKLHEFLFGDENYTPSDAVLAISEKIKSDSGRYKEGSFIESVSTDGGVIQKPRTSTSETRSPADEDDDDDTDSSHSNRKTTIGVDEDGNYIYPTDEDGNIIVPTDSNGDVIYPTDEDGNVVRESSVARPTELSTDDVTPGDDYYDFDEQDDPDAGGPTSATAANGNTHSTTSSSTTNPTGHSSTTTNPTADGSSNGSVSDSPGSISNSPVDTDTTGNTGTSPGSSTADSPGGSDSSTSTGPGSTGTASGPIVSTDGPGSISTGNLTGPGGN